MSDYYTHKDPRKAGRNDTFDYETGSGAGWFWALVVVVAFVGLIAIGVSGGGGGVEDGAEATSLAPTIEPVAPTVEPEFAPTAADQ